jgi:hypothetical protein
MSALPPKADIGTKLRNVRFVPKADSCGAAQISKLSTIASAGSSKRSPESGSISLVTTAPPIIDAGWF